MSLDHPILAACGLLIGLLAAWRASRLKAGRGLRRLLARFSFPAALACFALGSAGVEFQCDRPLRVAVLVDVSASARGASYLDPAVRTARLAKLLPGQTFETIFFADGRVSDSTVTTADRTRFPAVDADAVVLFSDGRFPPPGSAPPVFAVVDADLIDPPDARIAEIESRADSVAIAVETSIPATLTTPRGATLELAPGSRTVVEKNDASTSTEALRERASVRASDRWPENNALDFFPPLPTRQARYLIASDPPAAPAGWLISPAAALADDNFYASAAIVTLDSTAAAGLSPAGRRKLLFFVKDLGGTLFLTRAADLPDDLRAVSPLSVDPPGPPPRFALLLDRSGSMAAPTADGATRWQAAASAVAPLVAVLPREASVSIGAFARDVTWWTTDRPARLIDASALPVAAVPSGPTNLAAALAALGSASATAGPMNAVILTDGAAELTPEIMLPADVTLFVLATADLPAGSPLRTLAEKSGGRVITEADPARWASSLAGLGRTLGGAEAHRRPLTVVFTDALSRLGRRDIERWLPRFKKADATLLAHRAAASPTIATPDSLALAAWWPVGTGRVAEFSFALESAELNAAADALARATRDASFDVTWSGQRTIRVTMTPTLSAIDAEAGAVVPPTLRLVDPETGAEMKIAVVQIAPDVFEASFPAPAAPRWALIDSAGRPIERRALPGRYAVEFDAVGIDRAALVSLADRTGGAIVGPADDRRLALPRLSSRRSITPQLLAGGGALVALGLLALFPPTRPARRRPGEGRGLR